MRVICSQKVRVKSRRVPADREVPSAVWMSTYSQISMTPVKKKEKKGDFCKNKFCKEKKSLYSVILNHSKIICSSEMHATLNVWLAVICFNVLKHHKKNGNFKKQCLIFIYLR